MRLHVTIPPGVLVCCSRWITLSGRIRDDAVESSCAVAACALFVAVAIPGDAAPPAKVSVFVHVVAGGNVCGTDDHATVLNHPLANGNPNAVIVATSNTGASSAPSCSSPLRVS